MKNCGSCYIPRSCKYYANQPITFFKSIVLTSLTYKKYVIFEQLPDKVLPTLKYYFHFLHSIAREISKIEIRNLNSNLFAFLFIISRATFPGRSPLSYLNPYPGELLCCVLYTWYRSHLQHCRQSIYKAFCSNGHCLSRSQDTDARIWFTVPSHWYGSREYQYVHYALNFVQFLQLIAWQLFVTSLKHFLLNLLLFNSFQVCKNKILIALYRTPVFQNYTQPALLMFIATFCLELCQEYCINEIPIIFQWWLPMNQYDFTMWNALNKNK